MSHIVSFAIFSKQNQSRRIVVSLLILLIILFSVVYIIQTNSVAIGGYGIQEHKSEIAKLQSGNKNLRLKLSEVQSLSFLEEKIEKLEMIKLGKAEYLSPISQVAAR